MLFRALLVPVFLAAAATLLAADWTVDDLLLAERPSQLELSRDARWMAWIESRIDKDKGEAVSNVRARNLAGSFDVSIRRGRDNHAQPAFSPDSSRLAFLSSRKDPEAEAKGKPGEEKAGMQVWIADLRGGEP